MIRTKYSRSYEFFSFIVIMLMLTGCVDRMLSTKQNRKYQFEEYWNSQIGKNLDVSSNFKEVIERITESGDDSIEITLKQKYECRIMVREKKVSHEFISWHYASDPELCWVYMFSPW